MKLNDGRMHSDGCMYTLREFDLYMNIAMHG